MGVGDEDGAAVGFDVGCGDGLAVGEPGEKDGLNVEGLSEGVNVGDPGRFVGEPAVGRRVGVGVGKRVGVCERVGFGDGTPKNQVGYVVG